MEPGRQQPTFDLDDEAKDEEGSSEKTEEPEKTPEELEKERLAREEAQPSEAASESTEQATRREQRRSDKDVILDWLIKNGIDQIDTELFEKFKKALDEKYPDENSAENQDRTRVNSEALNETAELLVNLPEIFKNVNSKIAELEGKDGFETVFLKKAEIIKGICEPVLNGHLTAKDALALTGGIEIISKINPPDDMKNRVAAMKEASGYDGALFFDLSQNKIFIFEESLKDEYRNESGQLIKLDLRHMITHELSHAVVEQAVIGDPKLTAKADEIIEAASEFKDLQCQHIRSVLTGVENIDADFEKYFQICAARDPKLASPDGTVNEEIKSERKAKYVETRKKIATKEILTEYTAMYLKSDGSFDDFIQNCFKMTDPARFETALGLSKSELKKINNCTDPDVRSRLIDNLKQTNPRVMALFETFRVFYKGIKEGVQNKKGEFAPPEADEQELEDMNEFGGGYYDPAVSAPDSKGGQKNGLMSEIAAFFGAMSTLAPGGGSAPSQNASGGLV